MPLRLTHINLLQVFLYTFWVIVFILFIFALMEYPGNGYIYVLFSILSNILLYAGFRKNAIFFDTFIGIFFWLGFWLKLTVRVAFLDSEFTAEVYRYFDGSGGSFDNALIISSYAFLGLLSASLIREKIIFVYPSKSNEQVQEGLFGFYTKYRKYVLTGVVILFITIAVTNLFMGVYQRGSVPRTILPFGLSGVYKWLLLFGLATASAVILQFESRINKQTTYMPVILAFFENFFSNTSMLSRGMILNASALFYGLFKNVKLTGIISNNYFYIVSFIIFIALYGSSFILVDHVRNTIFKKNYLPITVDKQIINRFDVNISDSLNRIVHKKKLIFIDRWVEIEGVMSVSSYPEKGWDLWNDAWRETYSDYGTSFYDQNLINSRYKNRDITKVHFISLPGIIAFCFFRDHIYFYLAV